MSGPHAPAQKEDANSTSGPSTYSGPILSETDEVGDNAIVQGGSESISLNNHNASAPQKDGNDVRNKSTENAPPSVTSPQVPGPNDSGIRKANGNRAQEKDEPKEKKTMKRMFKGVKDFFSRLLRGKFSCIK